MNKLRKFNHHQEGMIESRLGDYYYDTEVNDFLRTQQAEIERLKGQRDRLVAEVKMYAGSTAYLAVDMRELIAEIEAEK